MAEEEDVCCNCGSILISGQYISEEDIAESNSNVVAQIVGNFSEIFRSAPGCIAVQKLSNVGISQSQSNVYEITCTKCKLSFRIILGRDSCYSCPTDDCLITPSRSRAASFSRAMSSYFPLALRRFIVEKSPDVKRQRLTTAQSEFCPTFQMSQCIPEMDDEADFDMMFSGNQECFVGSFTDQWIMNPEINFS